MTDSQNRGFKYLILLFCYVGLIFILSHLSSQSLRVIPFKIWDKAAHFGEYLPVGFLLYAWLRRRYRIFSSLKIIMFCTATLLGLALFDELHQYFVPTRDSDLLDVLADLLGGLTGITIAFIYSKYLRKIKVQTPPEVNQ